MTCVQQCEPITQLILSVTEALIGDHLLTGKLRLVTQYKRCSGMGS